MVNSPFISFLIKALNEEECIANCIESILREAEGLDFEIILADSLSTDQTVAIASQFPIRIVQFKNKADRGAGAAAQLAFQHAHGQLVYMLDGDMQMASGFLRQAISELEQDTQLAGVAGILQDTRVNNMFDRHRVKTKPSATAGYVKCLNGGGLYRKAAIDQVGYFAHRFIPAYEEAELGMRLRNASWRLKRLPIPAVLHTGHDDNTVQLLIRHWRNGYAFAAGMLLKSSFKAGYLKDAASVNKEPIVLLLIFFALPLSFFLGELEFLFLLAWIFLFLILLLKKRSFFDAAFSFFHWHYRAAGLLVGFFTKINDPKLLIDSVVVK